MPELFETMQTMRAMRRLKPDPVPDDLIRKILAAGVCAPNGANLQTWRFLVVKDPAIKQQVQVFYKRAFDEVMGPQYRTAAPPPGVTKEAYLRRWPRWNTSPTTSTRHPCGSSRVWTTARARRTAARARPFIPPCRTCCSPRVPSAWAPRSRHAI